MGHEIGSGAMGGWFCAVRSFAFRSPGGRDDNNRTGKSILVHDRGNLRPTGSRALYRTWPITVPSRTATPLFTGPNYGNVNSILLVISGAIPTGDTITLTFDSLPSVNFTSANFVSTAAAGFPTGPGGINGIANGDVNGVVFPTALHAGADLTGLPTGLFTDQLLANVTISQTIATNLRVDVFGDLNGRIVNNAANSGALGIGIPEPASLALFGAALFGLAFVKRRRKSA
jgi:hypothetical protein